MMMEPFYNAIRTKSSDFRVILTDGFNLLKDKAIIENNNNRSKQIFGQNGQFSFKRNRNYSNDFAMVNRMN